MPRSPKQNSASQPMYQSKLNLVVAKIQALLKALYTEKQQLAKQLGSVDARIMTLEARLEAQIDRLESQVAAMAGDSTAKTSRPAPAKPRAARSAPSAPAPTAAPTRPATQGRPTGAAIPQVPARTLPQAAAKPAGGRSAMTPTAGNGAESSASRVVN